MVFYQKRTICINWQKGGTLKYLFLLDNADFDLAPGTDIGLCPEEIFVDLIIYGKYK
jgi:hypothetical protein